MGWQASFEFVNRYPEHFRAISMVRLNGSLNEDTQNKVYNHLTKMSEELKTEAGSNLDAESIAQLTWTYIFGIEALRLCHPEISWKKDLEKTAYEILMSHIKGRK